MTTVLVTGVGAIIGYGILRSLRSSGKKMRLVGVDIYPDAVGQAWADDFHVAPLTSSDVYLDWMAKIIADDGVDLIIPGIEQDVLFYSDHLDAFGRDPVIVALNNQRLICLTRDKWLMDQELLRIDSQVRIPSFLDGDFEGLSRMLGLPFILKPRRGYASKGLVRVYNKEGFLPYAQRLGVELLAQPIVGRDDEEYTVAVFGDGRGQVCASITLQRRLANDGSTAKACVRMHSELDEVVRTLCSHFRPIGPTNLQFRRSDEGWKLLEINPRISSTTSLRTAFGYNEADMCLEFYCEGKKIVQPKIRRGIASRYIEDIIFYDRDHF